MGEAWQRWMEQRMAEVERASGVVPVPRPVEAVDDEATAAEPAAQALDVVPVPDAVGTAVLDDVAADIAAAVGASTGVSDAEVTAAELEAQIDAQIAAQASPVVDVSERGGPSSVVGGEG